ncbi:MAG: twin-arginine translocation signal domain-containing protein, partial [Deltaproteobacteria bacterium]|nr:twin-arginine translocation signal domain-containing protein [Deltaproteobacteria bacterium]
MAQTRREFLKKTAALSAASYVGMNLPYERMGVAEAADVQSWHKGSCRLCG